MDDKFKLYPEPKYNKIIEPFGFPVNYSLLYYDKQVIINDFSLEEFTPTDERMVNWTFSFKPYQNLINEKATWFVNALVRSKTVDYQYLCDWCKNRKGQVIVIAPLGATWLNFKELIKGELFWSNFSPKEFKSQLKIWS